MRNEIPVRYVPDVHREPIDQESLYAWLKDRYGLIPTWAEEEVYARAATEDEINTFALDNPTVLVIERISYLEGNAPFEFSSVVAPADSYRYRSRQINRTLSADTLKRLIKDVNAQTPIVT